jgi:hypothetical protein
MIIERRPTRSAAPAGRLRLETRSTGPDFGGWCVGAGVLVLRGGGPAADRRVLDDFRLRLELVLAADAAAQARDPGPVFGPGNGSQGDDPRPPEPGTAIARLAEGPAHRVILDVATGDALRRHRALATIRELRRPRPPRGPVAPVAPVAPIAGRRILADPKPTAVLASLLTAAIVESRGTEGTIPFAGSLLDTKGSPIGGVDGAIDVEWTTGIGAGTGTGAAS